MEEEEKKEEEKERGRTEKIEREDGVVAVALWLLWCCGCFGGVVLRESAVTRDNFAQLFLTIFLFFFNIHFKDTEQANDKEILISIFLFLLKKKIPSKRKRRGKES